MYKIKYEPVGRVYLSAGQKKEVAIKRLRHWVAVLAVADALYTALMIFIIYSAVVR